MSISEAAMLRDRVRRFMADHPDLQFGIFGEVPSRRDAVLDRMDAEALRFLLHDMHACCDVGLPPDLERLT